MCINMTREEIAIILKDLRVASGYSQKEAAEHVGKKQQTLASWETAQSQPDANTLFVLCELYGASVDEAFGFAESKGSFVLSSVERKIIENFRLLNEEGQEKSSDYISDLVQTGRYKKLDKICMGDEENAKQV